MKSIKELNIWNRQFLENKTPPHLTLTAEIFLIPLKLSFYPFFITKDKVHFNGISHSKKMRFRRTRSERNQRPQTLKPPNQKAPNPRRIGGFKMVEVSGFEPPASTSRT